MLTTKPAIAYGYNLANLLCLTLASFDAFIEEHILMRAFATIGIILIVNSYKDFLSLESLARWYHKIHIPYVLASISFSWLLGLQLVLNNKELNVGFVSGYLLLCYSIFSMVIFAHRLALKID